MGIPSYFVHIVNNHRNIIKKINKINVDNFYLDCNSIIYDEYYKLDKKLNKLEDIENIIIKNVCQKIVYYINLISPKKKIFIAFDGVAPIAKLEQQRNRRYKSWYINNEKLKELQDNNSEINNLDKKWDSTAITPGTNFMNNLYKKISKYFKDEFTKNNNEEIIISGSNDYGEGEHKIYKYIRNNEEYHKDTNTIIYGLDADLIMLTLVHLNISNNLYLFRETPQFITSINSNLSPNEHYVLDIYELGKKLKFGHSGWIHNNPGMYTLPGGSSKENESMIESAFREFYEETLDKNIFKFISRTKLLYYNKFCNIYYVNVNSIFYKNFIIFC